MKQISLFSLLTLLLTSCTCCHLPGTRTQTEKFDTTTVGELPPGWQAGITGPGTPRWAVVSDSTAPSAPNVLEQSGQVASHVYPWCVKTNVSLGDGFVQTKFQPFSGHEDQAGGVVWRWQDGDNYYIARGNALESNVILFRMVAGKRTEVRRVPFPIAAHRWHTLRARFHGPRIIVTCDGKKLIDLTDTTFPNPGAVGLWTKADSDTLFDNFEFGP